MIEKNLYLKTIFIILFFLFNQLKYIKEDFLNNVFLNMKINFPKVIF